MTGTIVLLMFLFLALSGEGFVKKGSIFREGEQGSEGSVKKRRGETLGSRPYQETIGHVLAML